MIHTSHNDQDKQRKLRKVAKTQPAVKAKTQPKPVVAITADETEAKSILSKSANPLDKIASKLLEGREQAGYTLIPAKKLKGNHR